MFVRYFTDLDLPFGAAEAILGGDADQWLPRLISDSEERSRDLLAEVGFGPKPLHLAKQVAVSVGLLLERPDRLVVPVAWRATGPQALFPRLEGDLELAPFGQARSQLAMTGRYTPPMGALGAALDRALFHRVAEATVRDFVERVADAMKTRAATPV